MGIGVSYTGYDGATRHSVAQGAADLPRIMGSQSPRIGDMFQRRSPQKPQSMPEHDPVDGPLIGIEGNDSPRPDGQVRVVGSKGGWRLPVTRTEEEIEPSVIMGCNKVTLTKLQYDVIISEKGLVKGRSAEREVWRKSFFVLAEDSAKSVASGKFAVRLVYTPDSSDPIHPIPRAFAFGTEADLATYDEDTENFACNYDANGRPLADPPVKVVATLEKEGEIEEIGG